MRKFIFSTILLAFLFPVLISASPLPRIYEMIRQGDYNTARNKLWMLYDQNGRDIAVNYGLALCYFMHDNPDRNLDSAQIFASRSVIILNDSVPEKLMKRYAKLGVRPYFIKWLQDAVYKEAFHRADSLGTVDAWNYYLNHYGLSPFYKEAVANRNARAFENAKIQFSYKSFQDFMAQYPDADQLSEAREMYELLLYKTQTIDSTWQVYLKFMQDYPLSPWYEQARENYDRLYYQYATRHHTLSDFSLFVSNNQNSPYVEEAKDSIYFLATIHHSAEEYDHFIKIFPNNPHVNEAWEKLYRLSTRDNSKSSFEQFANLHPGFPMMDLLNKEKNIAELPAIVFEDDESGLYGIMDSVTRQIILPAKYYWIDNFSCNLALFNPDSCESNCAFGFLDKKGNVVISPEYSDGNSFAGITASVVSGNCEEECLWGFINRFGEWLITPRYFVALGFEQGFSLVQEGSLFGFVNTNAAEAIVPKYQNAHPFIDSLAAVMKDSLWGFINMKDQTTISFQYLDLADFHESLCAAQDTTGLWGYIDKKGAWIIKPAYLKAASFEGGKAQVMIKPKNPQDLPKLKFINKLGKEVKK